MIDQLRKDIQRRLDEVLSEAQKLRNALAALGTRDGEALAGNAPPVRTAGSRSDGRRGARTAPRTRSQRATASRSRSTPGATRSAVLAALGSGDAMTAGEVATATGLGRASVSTTLSKLSKTGEVAKAERGYRVAKKS
jgi:DNA-binding transcriptional ArsR family regulator